MFTGTYPHISGHRNMENLIKPWEPNLFRSLKEDGYHVACLAPRGDTWAPTVAELSVTEYGFLETPEYLPRLFAGEEATMTDPRDHVWAKDESIWGRLFYRGRRDAKQVVDYDEGVIRSAVAWLECPPDDKPWVLFMPLLFPHCPFQVEEPYFSMYDRSKLSNAVSKPEKKTGYEPRYMKAIRERYGTDRATDEIWKEIKATYYGMITRLDDQFGRIIAKMEEKGYWDSTVTMFFTDHGEYLGDHGLIEKWHAGLSETLVHQPLIIGGAGLPQGKTVSAMTEMVDLLPTMFEMSGIEQSFPHNGKSWVPLLCDGATEHKEFAFSEGGFLAEEEPLLDSASFPYDLKMALQHEDTTLAGKAIAVRDLNWTFIYRIYEPSELYHRQQDPHEMHNRAEDPSVKHVYNRLEKVLLNWLVTSCDNMPWDSDGRFPKVNLKHPKQQMEERLKKRAAQLVNRETDRGA